MSLLRSAYDESRVIRQIREGGRPRQEAEYAVYDRFQYLVRKGMRKHGLSEDEAVDAYTDSVMALINSIIKGSFRSENKISTLLHQIFFNKCVDVFRKNANTLETSELIPESFMMPDKAQDIMQRITIDEHMDQLKGFMGQLGQSCREILWDSLYLGYRPAEIAEKLGLKNAETVLSQKSRCLKQLRTIIHNARDVFDPFST